MKKRINLNSNWLFLKDAATAADVLERAADAFERVDIPHTWNASDGQDGGDDYHRGLCWYRKSFDRPTVPAGGRVYIEFQAANSVADVYLNGWHLGQHRGGYSTFRLDATDHLQDGTNTLAVGVDNSHFEDVYPLFADFTFYGGIYRDVALVVTEPVHFDMLDLGSDGVYVTQISVTRARAELDITALVRSADRSQEVCTRVELLDADGRIVAQGDSASSVDGVRVHRVALSVKSPRLWDGRRDPYLYQCRVTLVADDRETDTISIPTGLRFFAFDSDRGFMLNGEALRLNGVSRHQDREAVGNALTREHQEEDMELIKEVGANSIRLAHYQHNRFFYDLCDREGMVVWAEIPYISRTSASDRKATNAISQMRELIRQNYNHASIVMWGVQNEIGIFSEERSLTDIVSEMHAVAKAEDPIRSTAQAQFMMITESDPANFITDAVAFNQYYGWYLGKTTGYDAFIRNFRRANPDRPMGYSEYGAEGIVTLHSNEPRVKDYSEEYHALFHEEVMAIFNAYDFIWGTYVWNMFDFGSDMRDEGGVKGRNNKGLVTFDRKVRKDAFYFYKSIWSDEKVLHISSKRFVDRHTSTIGIKVYSNLKNVVLLHNGNPVPLDSCDGTIHRFTITLRDGTNEVTARSGEIEDGATFVKVSEPNSSYELPEEERGKGIVEFKTDENVKNWFEAAPAEIGEIEYPEGYYSIKDSMETILSTDEGRAVMEEHFGALLKDDRLQMAMKVPFETIIGFQPDAFPESLVYAVNRKLNGIPK